MLRGWAQLEKSSTLEDTSSLDLPFLYVLCSQILYNSKYISVTFLWPVCLYFPLSAAGQSENPKFSHSYPSVVTGVRLIQPGESLHFIKSCLLIHRACSSKNAVVKLILVSFTQFCIALWAVPKALFHSLGRNPGTLEDASHPMISSKHTTKLQLTKEQKRPCLRSYHLSWSLATCFVFCSCLVCKTEMQNMPVKASWKTPVYAIEIGLN